MNIAKRLDRHFAVVAAAAASAAMLGGAEKANAAVHYSGIVNINIPSTTAGVYLNVVTGVFGTAAGTPGWDVNPWSSTTLNLFNPGAPAGGVYVGGATAPANLAFGTMIGASSTYGSGTFTGANLNSSNNLIGFRFQNEANGNQIHYGWMRISLAGSLSAQPRSIVEYAWEDVAGASIGAGVPAPGALALLGLAGLAGTRRRRN